ncbi:MAG: cyanophycinase [Balneolales bacterium]
MVTPQGKLIPIGGSENKNCRESGDCQTTFYESGILKRLLSEMKGADSRIELIPTASGVPELTTQRYISAFKKLGCENVGVLPIQNKQDAFNPEYVERIELSDGVFFTGGNQSRLGMFFTETPVLEVLTKRYINDDFVIAGTSAGAMAMSYRMITGGAPTSFEQGGVNISTGLSFINDTIIDTHFVKRGRFGRLTQAVAANPGSLGIGLAEDTGLILSSGSECEIIGSGQVIFIDGHALKHKVKSTLSTTLSVKDLAIHVLAREDTYSLKEHSFAGKTEALAS